MNRLKLLSPDFLIGKTLVLARSLVESVWLVLKQRNRQALHFARVLLVLKPRFTMVTNHNLIGLYSVVTTVNRLNLPGALVECGVWNGGSAAVMSLGDVEQARPSSLRAVWLFDSFEGLPRPSERDEEQIRAAYFEGWNQGSIANVRRAY